MPCERVLLPATLSRRAVLKGGAATLLACADVRGSSVRANELRVGATAPPATLVVLDGQRIATADLVGHVVILTF
jgi:hypothetical protein